MRYNLLSLLYRTTRFVITKIFYFFQKIFLKPKDLEPAVKIGDKGLIFIYPLKKVIFDFDIPKNIELNIFNLRFKSPLIASSFKSNEKIISIWLRMGLGGAILKTVMKNKREGNKRPRLQDVNFKGDKGIINALGLPGIGIDDFSSKLNKSHLWDFKCPIGISIGGDSKEEYLKNILKLEKINKNNDNQYFYELNISCPNTKDGKTIGDDPHLLNQLIEQIRDQINTPISVKISPDSKNEIIQSIAEICKKFEKIIINAGNTQFKKTADVNLKSNYLSTNGGGLSGKPIFERTLEMVSLLSPYNIPIIATGGVDNAQKVKLLKQEGAILYGMATSLVLDPYCIPKINSILKNV